MQEIPATNSQNMNTTATVESVWILRRDREYDQYYNDMNDALEAMKDYICDYKDSDELEEAINSEYEGVTIGTHYFSAYDIADQNGLANDVMRDILDDEFIPYISDYGEVAESEYSGYFDIIVGMKITDDEGVHIISDIDDYNGMNDTTELTDTDGIDWIITVHDNGDLTASRKPTTEYYLNIIVIKDGNAKVEELKCLGEDGFNKAIVECVKNGLTMCADTYRTEKVVKAFLLNVKEN